MIDIFVLIIVSLISLVIGMAIGGVIFIIQSKLSFLKAKNQLLKNVGIIENKIPEAKPIEEEGLKQVLEPQNEAIMDTGSNSLPHEQTEVTNKYAGLETYK